MRADINSEIYRLFVIKIWKFMIDVSQTEWLFKLIKNRTYFNSNVKKHQPLDWQSQNHQNNWSMELNSVQTLSSNGRQHVKKYLPWNDSFNRKSNNTEKHIRIQISFWLKIKN